MATNLQIDDKLIEKAVKLGGHKTKKAAVSKALIEYIQNLEQEKILSMFGTVEYDPEYDYKNQRRRSKGIKGSNTDFLICAMANRNNLSIFTTDKDFEQISMHIKLVRHKAE